MRLDPKLPEAPFTLGVVLWQTGRADDAVGLFREAIARKPDYAEAHYMLGVVLKQRARLDEAVEQFRTAITERPEMAEAHLSLGQALQQKGDGAGARAAYEEAERLNRRKADAQASTFAVSVGVEKLKTGNRKAAIEQFREAVKLAADNPQAHYQLALALRLTAPGEARQHFEDARRLAPYLRSPGTPAAECTAAHAAGRHP